MQVIYLKEGFYVENAESKWALKLQAEPFETLYELGFSETILEDEPGLNYLVKVAQTFVEVLKTDGDLEVTRKFRFPDETVYENLVQEVPFVIGSEFVTVTWLQAIHQAFAELFAQELAVFPGSVAEYIQAKNKALIIAGRVYFHLIERKDADSPFAFLATYSSGEKGKVSHFPLKNALLEFHDTKEMLALLSAVGRVANESVFISQFVESGELFAPLRFNEQEAYQFLKETPLYEANGVICRIPNFWKKTQKSTVKITIGDKQPSHVGIDALLAGRPEMYLGEDRYTKEEIKALLQQSEGLAFIKGKWVEVDHEKLAQLLEIYESAQEKEWSLFEALRRGQSTIENDQQAFLETTNGEWLSEIITNMTTPRTIHKSKFPGSFQATLRPYQETGYNWLTFMQAHGFGALLADDMGLGKTVQILALLDAIRPQKKRTLLVLPASLIENWKKEAAKFAPKLALRVLHGKNLTFDLTDADLFITTYGMVAKIDALKEETFDLLILDEAQAIKNPATKQTKSVKALHAQAKIAMTGTPIENQLSDLWSLFDFLNPGLLGSSKEFKQQMKNGADYRTLRKMITPFTLRRLKTDQQIISDLPEKNEIKEYIALSKKQIVLYKSVQKEMLQALEDSEGIQRKGMVLAAISKFKQICNHPDQYLGNQTFKPAMSGKFETLADICRTIRDKRERVLIFTQFKEMCEPLHTFLAEVFGQEGLVLHGGTPVKHRGDLVDTFNAPETYTPYMILSLKAGGVGLNLTAANHVIHFDRWWNPAIENQATDRAFRIGQEKNVFVYKFVTSGTIEEKIDQMLLEKLQLSTELITETSGEQWLTEMSNEELKQLFTLEVNP